MGRNPFKKAKEEADRSSKNFALDLAIVDRVEDDDSHQVTVSIASSVTEAEDKYPAMVPHKGDVALPEPGDMVVIGYARGQKPIVLGSVYTRQDNPQYEAGERIISSDGASVQLTESGSVKVTLADGEDFTIDGVPLETPIDNPLSFPHTSWSTANTDNEIWRVNLQSDETLKVYRLETKFKGGGTDTNFTIDLYDVDSGTVLAETSDVAVGEPIGTSGQGTTVIARITNDTGSEQIASINSKITIERER